MGAASNENRATVRFFVSYTGVKLPFRLVNELQPAEVENRNTFFRGYFDEQGRLSGFDKLTYSEIEISHHYEYHDNGTLKQAKIADIDEEVTVLNYDTDGTQIAD